MRQTLILSAIFGRLLTRVKYLWLPTKDSVTANRENEEESRTENVFKHSKGKLVSENRGRTWLTKKAGQMFQT